MSLSQNSADHPNITGCTCTGPGYCERHKIQKSLNWYNLCRYKKIYFQAWERGEGPGQVTDKQRFHKTKEIPNTMVSRKINKVIREPAKIVPKRIGVGTMLTRWFTSMGIKAHKGCYCKSLAANMDDVGVDVVEAKLEYYVEEMYKSAAQWRKERFFFPQPPKFAIRRLLQWAITACRNQVMTEFTLPENETQGV